MKSIKKLQMCLGIMGMIIALGAAGSSDYEDSVIDNMSQSAYDLVAASLPADATRSDIVREYLDNKEMYEQRVREMR